MGNQGNKGKSKKQDKFEKDEKKEQQKKRAEGSDMEEKQIETELIRGNRSGQPGTEQTASQN